MILDLETDAALPAPARYVIVGGGAVGLLLATTLSRHGASVVVLESGGRAFDSAAQSLNEAEIVGRPHRGVTEGRARLLGGTTHLWGGQLVAFDATDFEARPWLGLERWPIDRATLDPWYEAVARALGLDSTVGDDADVWRDLGLKQPMLGGTVPVVLTRWLKEPNFARLFGAELARSEHLTVVLNATCSDIRLDGGRITAVAATAPSGKTAWFDGEQVILACGTIEASRLMLELAARHPSAPWAVNAWVGRAFQDHLDTPAARVEILDKRRFSDLFDNIVRRGFKYQPKIKLPSTEYEALGISNIAASFSYHSSLTEHLGNLKIAMRSLIAGNAPKDIGGLVKSVLATARIWGPLIARYVRDHRVLSVGDLGVHMNLHCEQIPIRESRISLSSTRTDALGSPQAVLDWRVDGRELGAMRTICEWVGAALEADGIARLLVDPMLTESNPAFLDRCLDTNHHCGGLRMADNALDGVTDPDLKVHGTDNLFVAGAAVFPSSSFANPTFTAMALALRLADHLKAGR